nr:hypothetical protein [uncultured Rhodoferax sp.]
MSEITATPKNEIITMGFGSLQGFEFMQRTAKMFAQSSMVPTAYRAVVTKGFGDRMTYEDNPAALPNCIIALNMSQRMNADPLMIMQNLHVIEGRPSWSSQFIIAAINSCGRYSPLRFDIKQGAEIDATCTTFEWENGKKKAVVTKSRVKNATCIAWAIELSTQTRLESPMVTMEMAVNEGWYGKNGSKWQSMPDLMLRYRSAAFFGRIYAPELLMGLPSAEETGDIITVTEQPDGSYAADPAPQAPAQTVRQPQSKSAMAAASAAAEDATLKPETSTAKTVSQKNEIAQSPTGPTDPVTGEIIQEAPAAAKTASTTTASDASQGLASVGMKKNIIGRVAGNGLVMRNVLTQAGCGDLPDDLEGMSLDAFAAIKDVLPKV